MKKKQTKPNQLKGKKIKKWTAKSQVVAVQQCLIATRATIMKIRKNNIPLVLVELTIYPGVVSILSNRFIYQSFVLATQGAEREKFGRGDWASGVHGLYKKCIIFLILNGEKKSSRKILIRGGNLVNFITPLLLKVQVRFIQFSPRLIDVRV